MKRRRASGFDIRAAVREFYDDFPAERHRVFFFDVLPEKLIHDREGFDKALPLLRDARVQSEMTRYADEEASGCIVADGNAFIVMLCQSEDRTPLLGALAPQTQERYFLFDHELAHAIIKDALPGVQAETATEMVADAYAMIRHFQRFGQQSDGLDQLAFTRAARAVFIEHDASHLTISVIEKIMQLREKTDFTKFSPADTLALAAFAARGCAPGTADIAKLDAEIFNLSKSTALSVTESLAALTTQTLTTQNPMVFKCGDTILTQLFNKRDFKDVPEWQKALKALGIRRSRMDFIPPKKVRIS